MKNILKLTGISILALMAASGANAAGYTCEELIEYTSCNPGYWLTGGACPDGYTYGVSWCYDDAELHPDWECDDEYCPSEEERRNSCNDFGPFYGVGCFRNDVISDLNENHESSPYHQLELEELPDGAFITSAGGASCNGCPAGYSCSGGDAVATPCPAGSYQPESGKTSCIDAPAGNYVAGTGATGYTACVAGSYQPTAGQESCLECPAGSYCAGTGLSAVSGECSIGTYSFGGATSASCTACPATGLTDKDKNIVIATTETTGSTSPAACVVGNDVYFADIKGTYHYKSGCSFNNVSDVFFAGGVVDGICPDGYVAVYDFAVEVPGYDFDTEYGCFRAPVTKEECQTADIESGDFGGESVYTSWSIEEQKCNFCDIDFRYVLDGYNTVVCSSAR